MIFCLLGVAGADVEHVALWHAAWAPVNGAKNGMPDSSGQHGLDVGRAMQLNKAKVLGSASMADVGQAFFHIVLVVQRVEHDAAAWMPPRVPRQKAAFARPGACRSQLAQRARQRRGLAQHDLAFLRVGRRLRPKARATAAVPASMLRRTGQSGLEGRGMGGIPLCSETAPWCSSGTKNLSGNDNRTWYSSRL